jgi:hypothetical protein
MKPLTFIFTFLIISFSVIGQNAKIPELKNLKETSKIPKELVVKNGEVSIAKGYTASLSESGQVLTVRMSNNAGGTSITVTCGCGWFGARSCALILDDGKMTCGSCDGKGCTMVIGTSATANATGLDVTLGEDGNKTQWQILKIPAKNASKN